MTEFASDKLAILPLVSASQGPFLREFETLFVYSLMGRMALYTDARCQDLATKDDHAQLDASAGYDQTAMALRQIARDCGARFLLNGSLTLLADEERPERLEECRVTLRLFDAQENRFTGESPWACRAFEPSATADAGDAPGPWPRPQFDLFCELVNAGFSLAYEALFPNASTPEAFAAPPMAGSYEALRLLITADRLKGSTADKIEAYLQAVQADPHLEAAYFHLGNLRKSSGEYRQSVAHYRKALELSQGRSRVRAMYATEAGVCCALLGESDPAIHWWTRAIDIEPQALAPYLNLAHHYEERDDLDRAEAFFLQAQRIGPQDARPCYSLARVYCKRGDWERAIDQYQRQIACDGESGWPHNDIATCCLQLGRLQDARAHFERAATIDPHGEPGVYAALILSELSALDVAGA